jgi:tetratricopeptide (TPR) repeat protein
MMNLGLRAGTDDEQSPSDSRSLTNKAKKHGAVVPTADLAVEAQSLLSARRYREAIEVCKQLLKREPRAESRDALAQAYLGRAGELAAKGMFQEAAVLWENRASLCGISDRLDLYLDWLLRAGRYAKAAQVFAKKAPDLEDSDLRQRLDEVWAAYSLAGHAEIANALPADSPLLRQHGLVREAIAAYSRGDDSAAESLFKQIPYRSPYKDLRHILKAMAVLPVDSDAAARLLGQVAGESPFAPFAALIKVCTLVGDAFFEALGKLDGPAQELVAALAGADKAAVRAAAELHALAQREAVPALFRAVTTQVRAFDQGLAQRFCLALLPYFPRGVRDYEKLFGSLSEFEGQRIDALAEELRRDYEAAANHWRECAMLLEQGKDEDSRLRAALIYRHMVDLAVRDGVEPSSTICLDWLERSLALDAEDKSTYLVLLGIYRSLPQKSAEKDYKRWLEAAVERFPEDSEVLAEAMGAAVARHSFKKAAGFARTLLRLDPINSTARRVLVNAHLSHARKQIRSERFDLARKEFAQAASMEREGAESGVVQMAQGLAEMLAGQSEQGSALVEEGLRLAGSGVAAHLSLLVEAQRLKSDAAWLAPFRQRLKARGEGGLTKQEVLTLVGLVNTYRAEDSKGLDGALAPLFPALAQAAQGPYSEEELRTVCGCLHEVRHYSLLGIYAKAALERWRDRPIFVFYEVFARAEGVGYRVTPQQHDGERLERAYGEARAQHDHRAVQLIEEFWPFLRFGGFGKPGLPPLLDGEMEDLDPDMSELVDELGPQGLFDLIEAVAGLAGGREQREMRKLLERLKGLMDLLQDAEDPEPPELRGPKAGARKRGRGGGGSQGSLF